MGFTPQVVDLDGDGTHDILSGSWPGQLYRFSGDSQQILEHPDGRAINAGKASTVFACDWDDDADFDLLLGNIEGEVHLVVNEGSNAEPRYADPVALELDDRKASRKSAPIAADWNRDGLLDLIVGYSYGQVVLYRRKGFSAQRAVSLLPRGLVPTKLSLAPPVTLVPKAKHAKPGGATWGRRVKPAVCDWNRDGRLDLLLGDWTSKDGPRPTLSEEEEAARIAAVGELDELSQQLSRARQAWDALDADDMDPAQLSEDERAVRTAYEEARAAYRKVAEVAFSNRPETTHHGRVLVFLQKAAPGPAKK